jgi:hypothetical protein
MGIVDYKLIEKESIASLSFPKNEILRDKNDFKQLVSDLERVTILGNGANIKVDLFFEDNKNKYVVNTTVWGITDTAIILKQGVVIPINRIIKVSY